MHDGPGVAARAVTRAELLLAELGPALLRYFLRRSTDPEDAADLVSETFEAIWRSAKRIPLEREAARMWAFGVARNTHRHHVRGHARRDALIAELSSIVRESAPPADAADLDVRRAIAALPNDLAELIRLVHWDGFSIEQAAHLTNVSASTARSRHARAKQLLRVQLESTEPVALRHPQRATLG